jgi:hypothetical protein
MMADNFVRALRAMTRRRPFSPFAIEFHNGERIVVLHPEAVSFRNQVVYFNDPQNVPILFDASSVSRILGTA